MDTDQIFEGGDRRGFGSGFLTLIMGGVVLWVGKATFEHSGKLTGGPASDSGDWCTIRFTP